MEIIRQDIDTQKVSLLFYHTVYFAFILEVISGIGLSPSRLILIQSLSPVDVLNELLVGIAAMCASG